jgi:HEAT repeat protein
MHERDLSAVRSVLLRTSLAVVAALAALAGGLPRVGADEAAPELRYRWKPGQTYVYSVSIEADYGDYLDVLSGNVVYQVNSADQDGTKITFRGGLAEKQQLKPGQKGILLSRPRMPFSPFTGVGAARSTDMAVNDRGKVISIKGTSQLPFLLGNLSQLVLEKLPKDAQKTWKVSRELSIVESQSGLPRPPGLRGDDRNQIQATEDTGYAIDRATDDTATITRQVQLKTAETVAGQPRVQIEAEGTLTFDRKLGCFSKLEAQQKVIVREGGKVQETPLKISYRLLSESEKADLAKTAEGAPLFPGEPLTEALQKQALDDLKSGDKGRQLKALLLLGVKEPGKPNKEIAQAIEDLLTGKDASMRFSASRALIKWATPESVPALLKTLDSDDVSVRQAAMEALGNLKAESAAEPIAKRLPELSDRLKARQALEAIGPAAEPAVLKMADHADPFVRNEACTILTTIGTQKSVAKLTDLRENDPNALVKRTAGRALEAIEKRK